MISFFYILALKAHQHWEQTMHVMQANFTSTPDMSFGFKYEPNIGPSLNHA